MSNNYQQPAEAGATPFLPVPLAGAPVFIPQLPSDLAGVGVPPANAALYTLPVSGVGSPVMARVDDALNMPYSLQPGLLGARRLVSLLLPNIGQPGSAAGSFQTHGTGHTPSSAVWNSTTGSVVGAGAPSVWPWRPSLSIMGAAAANIGRVAVGGISEFIANGVAPFPGGFMVRVLCGCNAVAGMAGVLIGLIQNSLAVGAAIATQFATNGVYFFASTGGGNQWFVGSDTGAVRGGNIATGVVIFSQHLYELTLYMPPNPAPSGGAAGNILFWQVTDLTTGISASGSFACSSLGGPATARRFEFDVVDTATAPMDFMGASIEYDARVA